MTDGAVTAGPLDGVVVADFSRVLAGPYATMLLGDLGATVVKVEPPVGDETRHWGPPWYDDGSGERESTYYLSVNRNKASIVLDLTSAADRETAMRLVDRSDLLLENFRTGAMDRLGLGFDAVHARNPRLVYCSLTGYGSGAGADLPGYDLIVQAVSGLMSLTGPDEHTPTKQGVAAADVFTGLHAAIGMLAALHRARLTGTGQRLEVNLLSSTLSALVNFGGAYALTGDIAHGMGIRHPSICPYEPVDTADRPLVLAVGNDRQFGVLCAELGLAGVAADPRFGTNSERVAHREELLALLRPVLATATADTWHRRLSAAGIPCGPINDVAGGVELAEQLGLSPVVEVAGEGGRSVPQLATPFRLSATPPSYRRPPPRQGADTNEVLAWLDDAADGPS